MFERGLLQGCQECGLTRGLGYPLDLRGAAMRTRLTARVVREIVCPSHLAKVDVFDEVQRGFLLEIRKSGGKTFYQRYTNGRGQTRQIKIGAAGILNVSVARRRGREIVAQALLGTDPHEERVKLRSIPTLHQVVRERYLPHVKGYKRSWRTDETVLRLHILPTMGNRFLDEVTREDIEKLLSRLAGRGYSTGMTNRVTIVLRHLFNLCRQWRVAGVAENPTVGIRIAPDVCRERFLTKEEARFLVLSIEQDENKPAAQAIMLLLLTGARRNEVTFARWEHLDWERRRLLVPLSKSGKPRRIPLNGSALDLLRSIQPVTGNPYIFPSEVTGRPSASLHFPWDRIRRRAELPDVRLHDLRHSFASFLVNEGTSLYTVQKMLGHSTSRYTERYSHLTDETLSKAAEVLDLVVTRRV